MIGLAKAPSNHSCSFQMLAVAEAPGFVQFLELREEFSAVPGQITRDPRIVEQLAKVAAHDREVQSVRAEDSKATVKSL
jgi:hypothetical protein